MRFTVALVFMALLVPGMAQAAAKPCGDEMGHALDFWAGSWKVTAGGIVDGYNRIELVLDGCAIIENWEGTTAGDVGKSLFTYDARTHRWSQVWVRPDTTHAGGILHAELVAVLPDKSVRFSDATFGPKGQALLQRTTLSPLKDGTVRQLIEQSRDGGGTWTAAYDAIYTHDDAHPLTPPVANDPMPCRATAEGKALDFWVGDWTAIAVADGSKQGDNRLERILDGCAIIETWHGVDADDDVMSLFTFNAVSGLWDQFWVSPDTSRPGGLKNRHQIGALPGGAIRFQGTTFVALGRTVEDRSTLMPMADGHVHQTIETSRDGGKSWTTGFDAYYVRAKS